MSEFIFLYRDPGAGQASPQEMQARLQKWTVWFQDLTAKGHIKSKGQPLNAAGSVVRGAKRDVQDGPYAESKDIVIGYTVVEAENLAHATELAKGCPVLDGGGAVEVRPVRQM